MENSKENQTGGESRKNQPVQTENIAYDAGEMIDCRICDRRNPPNRLKCLYCGAELEFSDAQSEFLKPVLRRLEAWEKGFNLIYVPNDSPPLDGRKLKEISRMTRLEKDVLEKILQLTKPLPIARAESEKEAGIVRRRLSEFGMETLVLTDEKLAAETAPKRLRGLEFSAGAISLILFGADETVEISNKNLILIITGAIFQKRVEATEKYNKKGENVLLSATEIASDETLIDIYSRDGDENGFRIAQKGFDFSCLGADKSLLATENIQRLAEKLKAAAPAAALIEDYGEIRHALGSVWQIAERKDSKGLVRERFGKFNLGNVTLVSNLEQFTKYSRMLKNIYETEK